MLKIAYISYEYPPYTTGGGIGSYTFQISQAMALRGHQVSVFCKGDIDEVVLNKNKIVYYINSVDPASFKEDVLGRFEEIQKKENFDVVECSEYGADALRIKENHPSLPLVVKLHAPKFLIIRFNNLYYNYLIYPNFCTDDYLTILKKYYWLLRKKKLRKNIFKYSKTSDEEYKLASVADAVCSPSNKLAEVIKKDWRITKKIAIVPNVYIPDESLLKQPLSEKFQTFVFIGKLMVLKGVLDLCKAIPIVLKKHPTIKFIFVGEALNSPQNGVEMDEYIKNQLADYIESLQFKGSVLLSEIPYVLEDCDALILPSLWENFPTVCLEAMSAGKLVIGTNSGGIPEIIGKKFGLIAKRKNSKDLAEKILFAIENPKIMKELARKGREKVLNGYSGKIIGEKMEKIYYEAKSKCSHTML